MSIRRLQRMMAAAMLGRIAMMRSSNENSRAYALAETQRRGTSLLEVLCVVSLLGLVSLFGMMVIAPSFVRSLTSERQLNQFVAALNQSRRAAVLNQSESEVRLSKRDGRVVFAMIRTSGALDGISFAFDEDCRIECADPSIKFDAEGLAESSGEISVQLPHKNVAVEIHGGTGAVTVVER